MIQVAYASRTGHVEKIVGKLGLTNALKIVDGTEKLEGDYSELFYCDIPRRVSPGSWTSGRPPLRVICLPLSQIEVFL